MKKTIPDNHIELAGRVRVGERGQVVIPSELRETLQIATGDYLLALHVPDSDAVAFVHESKLQDLINQAGKNLHASLGGDQN